MVDALLPAVAALQRRCRRRPGPGATALRATAAGAERGMLATVPLVARKGRASYLGERSAGTQDPGATSSWLLLRGGRGYAARGVARDRPRPGEPQRAARRGRGRAGRADGRPRPAHRRGRRPRPAGRPLGTDAALVARAIERSGRDDGVLVLMDLGSAVLSAELALDLLPDERRRAKRAALRAPLVEGAVAAAVAAAARRLARGRRGRGRRRPGRQRWPSSRPSCRPAPRRPRARRLRGRPARDGTRVLRGAGTPAARQGA